MTQNLMTSLLMALLLLVAAALATRPWWRAPTPRQNRRAANVSAYRLRVDELDVEAAAGLVPIDEASSLRAELDARVLADAGDAEAEPAPPEPKRRWLAVVLITGLLAAFAGSWYAQSASWRVQREIAEETAPAPAVTPEVAAMVDKLAARLRQAPEDPEAWSMLGRSYFMMERYADSAQAYGQANTRAKTPNAEWLTAEGEATAFASNRKIAGRPAELFERALQVNPDDGKSLWFGGLAAAQAGDFAKARTRWQKLLATPDLPQPMREAIDERMQALDQAGAAAGGNPAAPDETGAAAPAAGSLQIEVSLAPALTAKVPPGATLFVFAKAESGPRIPLAVQRLASPQLPLKVRLDDSMAMAPTLKLSQFDRYVITARLSAGGGVQAQAGDLEGSVAAARAPGVQSLALTIDRVVP